MLVQLSLNRSERPATTLLLEPASSEETNIVTSRFVLDQQKRKEKKLQWSRKRSTTQNAEMMNSQQCHLVQKSPPAQRICSPQRRQRGSKQSEETNCGCSFSTVLCFFLFFYLIFFSWMDGWMDLEKPRHSTATPLALKETCRLPGDRSTHKRPKVAMGTDGW